MTGVSLAGNKWREFLWRETSGGQLFDGKRTASVSLAGNEWRALFAGNVRVAFFLTSSCVSWKYPVPRVFTVSSSGVRQFVLDDLSNLSNLNKRDLRTKINVNPELKGTVFGENIIDQAWGPYLKNIGHLDRTDRAQRQFLLHRKDQRPMFSLSAPSKLGYRTLKTWLRFKKFRPLLTQGLLLFQNRYPLEGDNKFAPRAHDSFTPAVNVWKCMILGFLLPFSIRAAHQ